MFDEDQSDPTCAVCGRRLLPGERPIAFLTRDGEAIEVCELCKPRAEAAGWLRPDEAEAGSGSAAGRDRRRARGVGVLGGLLSRRRPAAADPDPDPVSRPRAPEPAPIGDYEPDPDPLPAAATAGTSIADALYAFNHSDHRRTVAGLTRTLGPPRATALARKGNGDGEVVRLTIAWELTWYQWEVAGSGRGHDVRESGKGDTIDQLGSADRAWNLIVAANGTLEEKAASSAPAEEG